MIRLRSDNTVNVFGAVTSLPDRMVLVMELLSGGDLLTMLKKSKELLPEEQSRGIVRDICTGMAFLHSKNTVHGDLKSANVLLDGDGRAKVKMPLFDRCFGLWLHSLRWVVLITMYVSMSRFRIVCAWLSRMRLAAEPRYVLVVSSRQCIGRYAESSVQKVSVYYE